MKVVFYHRLPLATGNFSIERFFEDVRAALPSQVKQEVVRCRFRSQGLFRRVYNIVEAAFRQGDINHITGDVHYIAMFLRRHKTLLSVMDCMPLERERGAKWFLLFVIWYWLPARRARLITAISVATKNRLHQYLKCPEDKIRVIHCPVSECFQPAPREFNAARPVILQFNTGKHKNLERVAEAVRGVPCQLRIIGALEKEQEAVLREVGAEFTVRSNISDEEVVEEYRCCDLLVLASTYEGFGLPIVEAQATGRPVVTSNVLSMPEVSGGGACLVDPFDVASIRAGVLKVIENRRYREQLVERGFANVERFRPERIARQYVEVYQELSGNDRE